VRSIPDCGTIFSVIIENKEKVSIIKYGDLQDFESSIDSDKVAEELPELV